MLSFLRSYLPLMRCMAPCSLKVAGICYVPQSEHGLSIQVILGGIVMSEKGKGFDLAAALGAVSKLDTGADGRPQLEYIDIDLIDPDPKNRKVEGIKELAQNIALVGLQQPLAVRPNPEVDGRYVAVSGHRRRLAIKQLVDEGEEGLRAVPCLVAPPGMSDAMVRLMLLSGNLVTQGLTPAEMAESTKELEDAIYALKEEGKEFPGKVRDYVAKACGIAGSRVTRLKRIREGLIDDLKKDWEKGDLSESVAYAFAKETPEVQRLTVLSITRYGEVNTTRKWWQEWRIKKDADKIRNELKERKGPRGSCESCDATQQRLKRIIRCAEWDDHCGAGKCCHCCPNIGSCEFVCSHLSGEVAKAKVAAQDKKKAEKEKKQKEDAKQVAPTVRLWKRFGEARARAGLTFEEYAKKADARGFIREKKVADFEQGRKITPSSGGLPYTGGNGLDEWRIRPLIKAADALGVSIDYLLCRTDEPGMVRGPKVSSQDVPDEATWLTGAPKCDGQYYCKLKVDEADPMNIILIYDRYNGRWVHPADWSPVPYPVVGWWPLPQVEEDEEEKAEEDDEASNWDAEEDTK